MDNRKMIYLDDAINMMRQHSHFDDFDRCVIDESVAMKALKEIPPVQPEIIRCRECKHYDGRPCGIVDWYNTADDFCSRAERRTG